MASGQCSKWWRMRTNLEKTLISLSVILLLTLVIVILVGVVSRTGVESPSPEPAENFCKSKECVETAGSMMSRADFLVDPCDDFYEFACGTYARTRSGSKDSVRSSAKDILRIRLRNWLDSEVGTNAGIFDKARSLYRTCLKTNGSGVRMAVEEAFEVEKIGSWPVLDPYWRDDTHIESTLASLILMGMKVAFELQVVFNNTKEPILRISPSHEFDLLSESGDHKKEGQALKTYIISTLLHLEVPMSMAVEASEDIVSFESEFIQRIKLAHAECGNSELDDDRRVLRDVRVESVQQIKDYIPELDWSRLMNILYQESKAFQDLKNAPIEIYCRKYIRDLTERLVQFSPKTVFNYLGWKFFGPLVPYLGEPYRTISWAYRTISEEAEQDQLSSSEVGVSFPAKWSECLGLLEKHLLPIIATAHVQYDVSDERLDEKVRIASTLRSSLAQILSSVEWLDESEKELLKHEVAKSRFQLAMIKITSRIDEVTQYYQNLSLPKDDIISSILNLQKFDTSRNLENILKRSELAADWSKTSMTSDKLEYDDNNIAVYPDKIAPPYLYISQPSYLSYGSFASYLAKDLLEYITTISLRANKTIWDAMELRQKSKNCDSALYLNESVAKDEVSSILHSAMPDLTAIAVSFKAYKSLTGQDKESLPGFDYTDEQLFFLSYAQSYCEAPQEQILVLYGKRKTMPSRQRVNAVLRNFKPFSEVFSCESGSYMKPPLQCSAMGS